MGYTKGLDGVDMAKGKAMGGRSRPLPVSTAGRYQASKSKIYDTLSVERQQATYDE